MELKNKISIVKIVQTNFSNWFLTAVAMDKDIQKYRFLARLIRHNSKYSKITILSLLKII